MPTLYRFTLRLIQIGSRGQGAGGRGKELEINHLYQAFREIIQALGDIEHFGGQCLCKFIVTKYT
ncbi:hypothetical protein SAMD00079811_40910 [Scytonema sp. HK-05]|nr:hypothetical protein NIES2130_00970 [Scytonema sp. HK-05]BAY46479.1 hypothetical protein SAMD00079811_40910 [Scytonema sp. HK-05]